MLESGSKLLWNGDVEGVIGTHTRVDGISILVGDLNAELLLDGHDDLDGVEAVQTEVIGEVGSGFDLRGARD
jgi:hypothetical protein